MKVKKPFKLIIVVVSVVAFALIMNLHMPVVARFARTKVKVGMTAIQVKDALTGLGRYHLSCESGETVFGFNACAGIVSSKDNVKMTVLFMGPAFIHNEFDVFFGADSKVKEVGKVRSWD